MNAVSSFIKENLLALVVVFFMVVMTITQAAMCGLLRQTLTKIEEIQGGKGCIQTTISGRVSIDDTFPVDVKVDDRFPVEVQVEDRFPIKVQLQEHYILHGSPVPVRIVK